MSALVAIELHDAAPETWARCETLLAMLDEVGAKPISLLVVPWYHRGIAIDRAPAFVDAVSRRLARGDEAALHGFVHLDEAPPVRSVRALVARRMLTRSEGEFAAIDGTQARERIARALEIWRRVGWPIGGFVPPAWLLSRDARRAIASGSPFEYVALRRGVYRLPDWCWAATDTMWYSPTSAPRRAMSRALIALTAARASSARMLRIALHPRDAEVPSVVEHWREIVTRALDERRAVTTREALREIDRASDAEPVRLAAVHPIRASARARRSRRSALR